MGLIITASPTPLYTITPIATMTPIYTMNPNITGLDVMNSVHNFYNNAILLLLGLIAFVGLLIPIFITLFQRISAKAEEKRIESRLQDKLNKYIDDKFSDQFEKYKKGMLLLYKELNKNITNGVAASFDSQIIQSIQNDDDISTIRLFCSVIQLYLTMDFINDAQENLLQLFQFLESVDKDKIRLVKSNLEHTLDKLEKLNSPTNQFLIPISTIKKYLNEANTEEESQ